MRWKPDSDPSTGIKTKPVDARLPLASNLAHCVDPTGVADGPGLAVGVAVGTDVGLAVGVAVGFAVGEAVATGVGLALALATGVGEAVAAIVGVATGVGVDSLAPRIGATGLPAFPEHAASEIAMHAKPGSAERRRFDALFITTDLSKRQGGKGIT